jgi:hypothetical protein
MLIAQITGGIPEQQEKRRKARIVGTSRTRMDQRSDTADESTRYDNKGSETTAFDKVGMEQLPGKSSVKYWGYKRIIVSVLKWRERMCTHPIMKPSRMQ